MRDFLWRFAMQVRESKSLASGPHGDPGHFFSLVSPSFNVFFFFFFFRIINHERRFSELEILTSFLIRKSDDWWELVEFILLRVTDDVLAMARPSTAQLIKKNVIEQFKGWSIKTIINLQTPGEHSSCGGNLEESGFTYDPNHFMKNGSESLKDEHSLDFHSRFRNPRRWDAEKNFIV